MTDLIFKEECYKIVGSCMKIHTKLGKGFKEIVYKDALEIEFKKDKNVLYEREKAFNISYEKVVLPHRFNADFPFRVYYPRGKSGGACPNGRVQTNH